MSESEEREFIREKIIDKAGGRRHRIRKLLKLLITAVAFGLVAALFFVLGRMYLEPRFFPEETTQGEPIVIGRDPEENDTTAAQTETSPESLPETALETATNEAGEPAETGEGEETQAESGETGSQEQTDPPEPTTKAPVETSAGEDGEQETDPEEILKQKIEEAVQEAVQLALEEQEDYLALAEYRRLGQAMKTINKGLVTISSMTWDKDWFDNPVSSADQSAGAVIYLTDAEVLILADYASVAEAEALNVTFSGGKLVEARLKKADSITGIAIISVSRGAIPDEVKDSIVPLTLGNSYQLVTGTPILVGGSPAGYTGSVTNGIISCIQRNTAGTDTAFQIIYPNAHVAKSGGGFLFNMEGEVVGILSRLYGDEETGLPAAIGISSLKGIIKGLSSGIDVAYLGVQGQNATMEIAEMNEMPVGIYVTRVIVDSPAYEAGLRAGDIIVASGENDLTTTQKLQSFLENYSTGDVITIRAYRNGQDDYVEMEFEVTLGAR